VLIDDQLAGCAEGDNLIADAYSQSRKVVAGAFGPFEIDVFETRVQLGFLDVLLEHFHLAAECAVDAVRRNEDAALKAQALAQRALPQQYRVRVIYRSESVVKKYLLQIHNGILSPRGLLALGVDTGGTRGFLVPYCGGKQLPAFQFHTASTLGGKVTGHFTSCAAPRPSLYTVHLVAVATRTKML
jgi:hypothetical protein